MAKEAMTIKKVKDLKVELEMEILKLVKDFEKETETRITYISLKRPSKHEDLSEPVPERRGPVKSVDANMELDLF